MVIVALRSRKRSPLQISCKDARFAESRVDAQPGVMEVDNEGQPLKRVLTGAAYTDENTTPASTYPTLTVQTPDSTLLSKAFLRGDTIFCYSSTADDAEVAETTQIEKVVQQESGLPLILRLKSTVTNTAKFEVKMDIVQNISILSAIAFDDANGSTTAADKFKLRGLNYNTDTAKKTITQVQISKPVGMGTVNICSLYPRMRCMVSQPREMRSSSLLQTSFIQLS